MNLDKTALIVEGGGLRGVYTAGVLHYFMDRQFYLPYVIGVSSGACNCANYISRQKKRSRIVNIDYITDRRYISYSRWLTRGELFGMRFLFDTLPNRLVPFDYDTFFSSTQRFLVTVTDCFSGKALYIDRHTSRHRFLDVLRASCSLPLMSHPVHHDGLVLMDGGIADSVPIGKSIDDGNRKHILILTQPKGYRKKPNRFAGVVGLRYRRFPGLCRAVADRHSTYNAAMDTIDAMESSGEAFVIRPEQKLIVGRVERNQEKLAKVYDLGYTDARTAWERLCAYIDAVRE
jgi:predicted patatin/cPLA2 family phospholipase